MTKEQARKKLAELVEQFSKETNLTAYQEEDVKTTYIYPFLQLLGYSNEGKNHAEWEIHTESKTKRQKKVDYEISINSEVRFLVEAKRPSINLKKAPEPIYQIKNYCLHKRVPIGLLTDFEEFMLYFNIKSPDIDDKTGGLLKSLHYTQYMDNFDFIYDTLSKEAVLKDSLAVLIAKNIPEFSKIQKSEVQLALFKTKGREELDKEFLQDLDDWRKEIAQSLATNNKKLTDKEVTAFTQKLIDRILFIKITEDKDITDSDFLLDMTESDNIWSKLLDTFKILNDKFNGSLFTADDKFTDLNIDNQVLYDFIRSFYFTGKKTKYQTPKYHFDYIPVEILGSIYERFLGQVVRLTPARRVIVEDKPEVKKAGGVYYTPEYIVKYIVENTIGEKIKGKKPEEIAKMSFLDPACGSGSFLIGAFDYLIKYHEQYYSEHPAEGKKQPDKKKKYLYDSYTKDENNQFVLTTDKKAEILQNNIYGVDIDPQAVEVTKLSLYIKMIEEGQMQIRLLSHPVLPSMDNNIKCGNSLIGHDIYHGDTLSLFEENEKEKVNAFDWEVEYKQKFDVVIGNPPYINAITLVENYKKERNYLDNSNNYKTLFQKWDIYIAFIEKGLNLLKSEGYISMIIPHPFLNQMYAKLSRINILENYHLSTLVDLSPEKIFKDAVVNNCIFVIENTKLRDMTSIEKISNGIIIKDSNLKQMQLIKDKNSYIWSLNKKPQLLFDSKKFNTLGDYCFVSIGMVLNADEKKAKGKFVKEDLLSDKKTKTHSKKYVEAKNIDKYIIINSRYLEWNTSRVPALIRRPTFPELYECPKILLSKIGNMKAVFDTSKLYCDQTIRIVILWKYLKGVENASINNSIKKYYNFPREILENNSKSVSNEYILAIINSTLGNYLLNQIRGEGNIDINPDYVKNIPIPKILEENQKIQSKIIKLINSIQELVNSKNEKLREINFLQSEINQFVYQLYGLSEEEIKNIEDLTNDK